MAVLLKDLWHSAVVKSRYVSSIILWIKFKFSSVKYCVVVGYGPTEGDGEERVSFLVLRRWKEVWKVWPSY